jgi:hypothetical protein
MNCKQLLDLIAGELDFQIKIMLPDGKFVPEHFHITEIGIVEKNFIDCGGIKRSQTCVVLQVWVAHDTEHRLTRLKLNKILSMVTSLSQPHHRFYADAYPIEIEYGADLVSQYPVKDVELTDDNELLFVLGGKRTECLAPDKCGCA